MSREIRRKQAYLREENARFPRSLVSIPREIWPPNPFNTKPAEVWRSRDYLVQIFPEIDGAIRMTVCRTMIDDAGMWVDGITWESLMRLKSECGRTDAWAVEIFPPENELVNVASMRHLWLLPSAPTFAWRKQPAALPPALDRLLKEETKR